jgi:hypothetical protein
MLVNDEARPVNGLLRLSLENERGELVARAEEPFAMQAFGDQSLEIPLTLPDLSGPCVLRATAQPQRGLGLTPTVSRRRVTLVPDAQPDKPKPPEKKKRKQSKGIGLF